MNTLLINLEHSKERLKFQTNQLEKLGISFSVLKAVSLEDGTWQVEGLEGKIPMVFSLQAVKK